MLRASSYSFSSSHGARRTVYNKVFFIVKRYDKTESVVQTQRDVCKQFNYRRTPYRSTIISLIKRFESTGDLKVKDNVKGVVGRKKSVHMEENVARFHEALTRSPHKSINRLL